MRKSLSEQLYPKRCVPRVGRSVELVILAERNLRGNLLPKSPLGGAIGHTLSNRAALGRYCGDADLPIDNNASERSLRGVAVGRRNWMIFGSDQGGKTAAVPTSFMASCQRVKIDPFAYLKGVLGRVASHPVTQLDRLLPANRTSVAAQARFTGGATGLNRHGFTGRVHHSGTEGGGVYGRWSGIGGMGCGSPSRGERIRSERGQWHAGLDRRR